VSSYGIYKKEVSQKKTEGWQKQREMIPLCYKTNTITTNKANHRNVFAKPRGKELAEKKRSSSNLVQKLGDFRVFASLSIVASPLALPGQVGDSRVRVHNSTPTV